MPIFEYHDLPTATALDRQRHRTTVWARADAGGPALFLGDIWCSPATQEWHYTVGARNLQKQEIVARLATREDAAQALFRNRQEQADASVRAALDQANALRAVTGERPLLIEPANFTS